MWVFVPNHVPCSSITLSTVANSLGDFSKYPYTIAGRIRRAVVLEADSRTLPASPARWFDL